MQRVQALVKKEFIQFFRYRPLVFLVVWTIAIEIAICAYAITYDVTHLSLAVEDLDRSQESRELVNRFAQTEYFDVNYSAATLAEIEHLLESGKVDLGISIPADFSRRLAQGIQSSTQILLDGSNSNSALIALGYAERIIRSYSRGIEVTRLLKGAGMAGPLPGIKNQLRSWYNPDLKSVDFVVVSMLVLGVMMIATIHPAAAVAWEKEAGTIEQLMVMPFRPWEIMVAKIAPTFVVSLGSLALALWVPWWFAVPIKGSLLLFFALTALFLFSSLGWGLFLGSLSENLQQALLLAFFFHLSHPGDFRDSRSGRNDAATSSITLPFKPADLLYGNRPWHFSQRRWICPALASGAGYERSRCDDFFMRPMAVWQEARMSERELPAPVPSIFIVNHSAEGNFFVDNDAKIPLGVAALLWFFLFTVREVR